MNKIIIVYFDNMCGEFGNDEYENISKDEAVKAFKTAHNKYYVITNIIEL